MGYRDMQAAFGMGAPKAAQQVGPVGGGAIAQPLADAQNERDAEIERQQQEAAYGSNPENLKRGGKVSSASKRADGIAARGKTRGKIV